MPPSVTPIDRAAKHEPSELFFSTTDRKGRITGCNDVFLRIAGYAPEDVLGAPHNLIRHPDVPRCVFHLLWEHLLAGRAIGAYVKNMTCEGEYYWVYALAVPIEGGFLSVRLKPTSPLLATVEALYTKLLGTERAFGKQRAEGMAASEAELLATLAELGFADYGSFMAHALRVELRARDGLMTEGGDERTTKVLAELEELETLQRRTNALTRSLTAASVAINRTALNMSVCVSRMDDRDGARSALGVLAEQTATIATEVSRWSADLGDVSASLSTSLVDTSVHVSYSALVAEMTRSFEDEASRCELRAPEQRARYGSTCDELARMLASIHARSLADAGEGRDGLRDALRAFGSIAESFARTLLTTRVSHVTGRSLAAGLADGAHFCGLLDGMVETAARARGELDELQESAALVDSILKTWSFAVDRASSHAA